MKNIKLAQNNVKIIKKYDSFTLLHEKYVVKTQDFLMKNIKLEQNNVKIITIIMVLTL